MKTPTTAIVLCLSLAAPVHAEVHDPFVLQLQEQGYSQITVGRTWLGRIVINARRDDISREIILNARTGELLGDLASAAQLPQAPRYSTVESSDSDEDRGTVTASVPPAADPDPNAVTATSLEMGDTRAILDTGDTAVAGD